jgi:putative flippase GtrA
VFGVACSLLSLIRHAPAAGEIAALQCLSKEVLLFVESDFGIPSLAERHSTWLQLVRFCLVGASGYVVNLIVFATLLRAAGLHYTAAAVGAFFLAVTNNYAWNRLWTFRVERGPVAEQGARFFVVASLSLGANLIFLGAFVALGVSAIPAQASAIVLATPLNFLGCKLWTFRPE